VERRQRARGSVAWIEEQGFEHKGCALTKGGEKKEPFPNRSLVQLDKNSTAVPVCRPGTFFYLRQSEKLAGGGSGIMNRWRQRLGETGTSFLRLGTGGKRLVLHELGGGKLDAPRRAFKKEGLERDPYRGGRRDNGH